jgi:hypothetical protein
MAGPFTSTLGTPYSALGAGMLLGAAPPGLQLITALAIAENVIRVGFNAPVYISNLLDAPDASNPALYTVTPDAGTVGMDGLPARGVSVASVAASTDDLPVGAAPGTYLDLTLDRPMSPYAASYRVACAGLFDASLVLSLDPAHSTIDNVLGTFREVVRPSIDSPTDGRDIANPQTLAAAQSVGTDVPLDSLNLGAFVVDASGDYAFDSGLVAYKKRVYRRLVSRPGGFLHLGDGYGVGIPLEGKRLASTSVLERLAAKAEQQIAREPETEKVRVTAVTDPNVPGLVRFRIVARTRGGLTAAFEAPFRVT